MHKNFFCFILLLVLLVGSDSATARSYIRVTINDLPVVLAVPPVIESGRTLLPIRFVAQSLGASVQWSQSGTVTIRRGENTVILTKNSKLAIVDGRQVLLDVPSRLIHNRTFVPISFIARSLGTGISWDRNTRTISIRTEGNNVFAPVSQPTVPSGNNITTGNGQVLYIGMSAEMILALLGEPDRREISGLGYDWWVYNSNPGRLVLIEVADNRMASLYVDDPDWKVAGVRKGYTQTELEATHKLNSKVDIEYAGISYLLSLRSSQLAEEPVAVAGENILMFYRDNQRNHEVKGMRIFSKRTFLLAQRHARRVTWTGNRQPISPPKLEGDTLIRAQRGQERVMMDLVNAFRVQNGASPLTWLEELAVVSRSHSKDMFENNFFDHFSPTTGSLSDRVEKAGFDFLMAGENLAWGYADAVCANHGLINSPPHRRGMLNPQARQIGIGYQDRTYTQKFISLR